jgi:raffinose/stachyose/melibiose transport system permease protein
VPGLALLAVIIVIPLVWNVYLTFTDYRGIRPPEWIGLDNWIELAGDSVFWTSFGNSIAMIVAMVVVPTLLGLVLAAMLFDLIGKKFGGRLASFLRATYYLPQILPAVIAAIVIGWILRPQNGALNQMLEAVGLGALQQNWLGDPDTALPSIMVIMIWVQLGYPIVIFMAAPAACRPRALRGRRARRRELVPAFPGDHRSASSGPRSSSCTLTCTIAALKVFGPIYALTGGGPGTATDRARVLRVQRVLPVAAGRLRRDHRDRPHRRHRRGQRGVHPRAEPRGAEGGGTMSAVLDEATATLDASVQEPKPARPGPRRQPAARRPATGSCCSWRSCSACSSRCRSCSSSSTRSSRPADYNTSAR